MTIARRLMLDWMVYSADGDLIARCHHPEDAARLLDPGMTVAHGQTGRTVWTEGSEDFSAAKSYDRFAEVVIERVRKARAG